MTEQAQYISGRTVQEQMDNLIKYVDDRSKTVAEGEAQRVLVPAEAAKVAAEAAADRAESSVGQFETRLQGVEDGVAGNRSSIQTIDGEITDIYNDLTNVVRKVGEAGQVVMNGLDLRGNNSVPDTVIGQNDSKPVNGKRVIGELDAYAPMMRTTGNQSVYGRKAINSLAQRNVNGQGASTTCLELFRFKRTVNQDHRFNMLTNVGYKVALFFLRIQTGDSTVNIMDGVKTLLGDATGNKTIGAGFTDDGWVVVYEKQEAYCIFCTLMSAFTGSRFPIVEANISMANQCNIIEPSDLSGVMEVTL